MKQLRNRASFLFCGVNSPVILLRRYALLLISFFLFYNVSALRAGTLQNHLKRLTSALSNRNLDSLRLLIDPNRIYVEIAPKEGSYLSPSQTLGVVESYFRTHPPVSFSYLLVKEEGRTGIAIGTLVVGESNRTISRKVNFGFQKDNHENWLLSRINIR